MAHLETRLIHAGHDTDISSGAVVTPIFQTSTFRDGAHDASRTYDAVRYTRLSNGPQHEVLHQRLAAITETDKALTSSSGMAAISATLMALGGRAFFSRHLYGGTAHLVSHDLPRLGIPCDVATHDDVSTWEAELHPDTKVLYVEAISNPTNVILDLPAVVALARRRGLVSVIDATFASPVNLLPSRLGFDLEVHSATKYLNGHSDVIAGLVAGRADLVDRIHALQNHLGGSLDPHALFLLERGLKTLALRVRHQNRSALTLARALATHPKVRHTTHPLLTTPAGHPHFHGYGGVFSFELDNGALAERLIDGLTLATHAPSLGGPETLVTRP
ncbi:MAG TPA: PLP-dependent aspartate aminotransferase family protein, partial [Myxococcota bacterium]|nr:PLP-dependent aspartate aminotransferase family protein [Myxococcota bacterium]